MPDTVSNQTGPMQGNVQGTGTPYAWVAVTPADTDLTRGYCQWLMVLEDAKNVTAINSDGTTVLFTAIPKGTVIRGSFKQIKATGTNATVVYVGYSI